MCLLPKERKLTRLKVIGYYTPLNIKPKEAEKKFFSPVRQNTLLRR